MKWMAPVRYSPLPLKKNLAAKENGNMAALAASIRAMQLADLDFAAQCTAAEGWLSENRSSLEGFYQHDPAGCLLAEVDGKPAGICVATPYGKSGFIGELIVRPEARGKGLGAALLNHAVDYLRQKGAGTVYLDGVLPAVPLYERNGFRKICRSYRLAGKLAGQSHADVRTMTPADLPAVVALDRRFFGTDRSFFLARRLELFPRLSKVMFSGEMVTGYILGRRGEGWVSAGPWVVSEQNSTPTHLLDSFAQELELHDFSLGILSSNSAAVDLIKSLGFAERRVGLWRMSLGPAQDLGASPYCLAVGSAAKG
jgi:ribosomal protein S18 acetylase RimI-like enzyme